MGITLDSLTTNETLAPRLRTFSPEVVKRIAELLTGSPDSPPVQNVGVGEFDKEGSARSALVALNRALAQYNVSPRASTVRRTEAGYKAIILNKPAKVVERKPKTTTTAKSK